LFESGRVAFHFLCNKLTTHQDSNTVFLHSDHCTDVRTQAACTFLFNFVDAKKLHYMEEQPYSIKKQQLAILGE